MRRFNAVFCLFGAGTHREAVSDQYKYAKFPGFQFGQLDGVSARALRPPRHRSGEQSTRSSKFIAYNPRKSLEK